MNTILWIMQGVLALVFLFPGIGKVTITKESLLEKAGPAASVLPIRMLGLAELLGVVGILVPLLTGVAPVLTPVSALCFGLVMVGAFIVHYQKKDFKILPLLLPIFIMSLLVAYYRFP